MSSGRNGKTEGGGGGDGGAEGVDEVVVVSEGVPLLTTSGIEGPMLMSTGERGAAAAAAVMKGIMAVVDNLTVVIDLKEEAGDAEDADKTTTTVMGDPLLIMALTRFPRLHPQRTPLMWLRLKQ